MLPFKLVVHVDQIPHNTDCIMVGDIGGTNSNFGFFKLVDDHFLFLFSMHFKSQQIEDFPVLILDIMTYVRDTYNLTIMQAGFAAAGVVSQTRDYSKPTNLNLIIDAKEIIKKTGLHCSFIVNDFEVIGYGLGLIAPTDLVLVNKGKPRINSNMGILGAGTGLGKCIMHWDVYAGRHVPVASEGGHADFPSQNQLELDLVEFIKKTESRDCPVSWEDLLSGDGIERMYRFFHQYDGDDGVVHEIDYRGPHPDEIFKSRTLDGHAKRTFELYTQIYARCAKNFALEALALGGIFIAGGIAAKNLPMFELEVFMEEFIKCGKQQSILQNIPIYVITDYNVSLYGAARYMQLEGMCK